MDHSFCRSFIVASSITSINNSGLNAEPWWTPTSTPKHSDIPPATKTRDLVLWYNAITSVSGMCCLLIAQTKATLGTLSKAFSRYTNTWYNFFLSHVFLLQLPYYKYCIKCWSSCHKYYVSSYQAFFYEKKGFGFDGFRWWLFKVTLKQKTTFAELCKFDNLKLREVQIWFHNYYNTFIQ